MAGTAVIENSLIASNNELAFVVAFGLTGFPSFFVLASATHGLIDIHRSTLINQPQSISKNRVT
ncbi:hypothetical protein [Secundilactobacillus kimchicus]|uniref:hypothetical protein n=1 Tax=Secundilactobacillus kimchicus TaxID=528209 RepID=UPI0024A9B9AE|nr:hypothetical protein [Secundilactobacillus kimchicus]